MKKITLITPPDVFENQSQSILFVNITEQQQDQVSHYFGQLDSDTPLNIYYYQGENNLEWLLFTLNRSDAVFVNADTDSDITRWLLSYVLSKHNVWYNTDDVNMKALWSYINQKYVKDIKTFLEVQFEQNNS
jgi:hypothetical protein